MAQISGIEVQSITSMYGVNVASIVSIGGIATANIPGWPGAGPSCTTVNYGYSDGERNPPEEACIAEQLPYEWDSSTGLLYTEGSCGVELARPGYYSDGKNIYFWDGGRLSEYGPCNTVYEGPWVSTIYTDDTMGMNGQYPRESLIALYTADLRMPSIIPSFNGEIWGFSLEVSTDGGGSYGAPSYYAGTGSPVASPMDMFAYDKGGIPTTSYYFTGYGTNQPWSNRLLIAVTESPTPYYGPQPYPLRLFNGQYYRQRIYPFWQDLGSFYETVFDSGDNFESPFRIASQTNYYNGSPNM